jgi:hypothetical protein
VPENDHNGGPSARASSETCIVHVRNDANGRLLVLRLVELCRAYDCAHRNRDLIMPLCPKAAITQTDAARNLWVTALSQRRQGNAPAADADRPVQQ